MTHAGASGGVIPVERIADEQRIAELEAVVRQALGYALEPNLFAALVEVQKNLWNIDASLDQSLEAKQISPQEYLDRMDTAMVSAMNDSRNLLGTSRFSRIFGDAGNHPNGMIDHDAFLSGM